PYRWAKKIFKWREYDDIPKVFVEGYVLLWFFVILLLFYELQSENSKLKYILLGLAFWRLADILLEKLRIVIVEFQDSQKTGGERVLKTRGGVRWVLLTLINIAEVILCFAVVYHFWGSNFCGEIQGKIVAIYYSIVTITTLGYGEIHPNTYPSHLLVIMQLAYFLFLLLTILPIVVSIFKVRE
ncbi:MAG: ion channel, partial [Pseudomonadota bacterium]